MINPLAPARPDLASLRKLHADRIALRWEEYWAARCALYIQGAEIYLGHRDHPTALRELRILHSMRVVQALARGLRWKTITRPTTDLDSPLRSTGEFHHILNTLAHRVAVQKSKFIRTPLRRTLHARKP